MFDAGALCDDVLATLGQSFNLAIAQAQRPKPPAPRCFPGESEYSQPLPPPQPVTYEVATGMEGLQRRARFVRCRPDRKCISPHFGFGHCFVPGCTGRPVHGGGPV